MWWRRTRRRDDQLFDRVPKAVFRSEVVDKQPHRHARGGRDRPHGRAVLAVPNWQERPVVLAVTDNGQEIPIEDIHRLLSGSFARWQLPDTVIYVDALPRTSVGKLDKKAMRAAYADVYRPATSAAPS